VLPGWDGGIKVQPGAGQVDVWRRHLDHLAQATVYRPVRTSHQLGPLGFRTSITGFRGASGT